MMLMTFWRTWHAHNEMTHGKPCPSVEGSRRFLVRYLNSLLTIKQFPEADMAKGKMVVDPKQGFRRDKDVTRKQWKVRQKWKPPDVNTVKLNVDGAYSQDGRAGCGVVVRDSAGEVIVAACLQLHHCKDATEAEVAAIEEGVNLAMQWTQLPFSVESDCADAVQMINSRAPNISANAFRISVIRENLLERNSKLVKIGREANVASHELAKLARVHGRTNVWLSVPPPEIAGVIASDCNLSIV
jgi:ribonuclease HI